ncbi:putative Cysteine-rich venom protein pseudechetoxin-like [Hypsibius exemplaris]|uniref:Cysteine-rich venom protein pseudechetoxin-like n=1 Tax=Hypsibius exemplaris TaxID=2072580 RepID=A0A1W0XBH6_HYPEX|nr:putative Cysteine-rich venom protein pseudechetoxin-like [Hypsibius exemplaris]
MAFLTSFLFFGLSVTAVYGATYEQPLPAGSPPTTSNLNGAPAFSIESLMGPADPIPKNNETLTAVRIANKQQLAAAPVPIASLVTANKPVQDLITNELNRLRRQAGATNMLKLNWDAEIQGTAQTWADQCVFQHPSSYVEKAAVLKTSKFSLGQNIAMATGAINWTSIIDLWAGEAKRFKFGQPPASGTVVGHYTAMVWAASSAVGCAYALCPAGKITSGPSHIFVCNFGPAGNVAPNQFKPYEVGTKCSKCAKSCEDELCTNPCNYTNDYSNCEISAAYSALFPNGCKNAEAVNAPFKSGCKATCLCKDADLLYTA